MCAFKKTILTFHNRNWKCRANLHFDISTWNISKEISYLVIILRSFKKFKILKQNFKKILESYILRHFLILNFSNVNLDYK